MAAPQDPLDELRIPDGTTVEEHDVVTDGDILVGSNSTVDFGLRGRTIAAGERVEFGRQIEADGDCRLDMWCETDGSVLAGEDAYIGERTHIGGQLLVSGDLDIGDDVSIDEGFEANGWIVTRNPVPVLVFYFIVLSQFLRVGDTDKADEFASALAGEGIEERSPLVIPRGSDISDDVWRVSEPATIGDDCRIHGNIRAESITVGDGTTIFGSLRARDDITVGNNTVIIGDVTTRGGTITLAAGSHVRGDVSCGDLVVNEGADVDGTLRATGEMKLIQQTDAASTAATGQNTTVDDWTDSEPPTAETTVETTEAAETVEETTETVAEKSTETAGDSLAADDSTDSEATPEESTADTSDIEAGDAVADSYLAGSTEPVEDVDAAVEADDESATPQTSETVGDAYITTEADPNDVSDAYVTTATAADESADDTAGAEILDADEAEAETESESSESADADADSPESEESEESGDSDSDDPDPSVIETDEGVEILDADAAATDEE